MSDNTNYIKTGFDVLDKMLGGEGIKLGTSVLVRGQPGSGKTTLGLQILDSYLKKNSDPNVKKSALVISLEEDYKTLMIEVNNNFGFFESFGENIKKLSNETKDNLIILNNNNNNCLITLNREYIENGLMVTRDQPAHRDLKKLLSDCLEKILMEIKAKEGSKILFIDSLNVFVNIIMRQTEEKDIRYIINSIYKCVQDNLKDSIVIFTGEYHQDESSYGYSIAESFFADTEILLTSESIKGKAERNRNNISSLGYDIEPGEDIGSYVESRSFCRILKSRYNRSQSRRCSYDIEPKKGLVFYETYPGDGTIILFQENRPQEKAWEDFFKNDLPRLYPSLRYDAFDRNALQRTFAAQRRHIHIPDRVDMYLLSFDTYWVNWYREFYQRGEIYTYFYDLFDNSESNPQKIEQIAFMTSLVHRMLQSSNITNVKKRLLDNRFINKLYIKNNESLINILEKSLKNKLNEIIDFFFDPDNKKPKSIFESSQSGLFELLDADNIRLFGEIRSTIIEELEKPDPLQNRPIYRTQNKNTYLSIPYDANISFIVCNKINLMKAINFISQDIKIQSDFKECIYKIYQYEMEKIIPSQKDKIKQVINYRVQKLIQTGNPETWEEMIALCTLTDKKYDLLLETQTFDTLLCSFMEIYWSFGEYMHIRPDYTFKKKKVCKLNLNRAFNLLNVMFNGIINDHIDKVIPDNCSLVP